MLSWSLESWLMRGKVYRLMAIFHLPFSLPVAVPTSSHRWELMPARSHWQPRAKGWEKGELCSASPAVIGLLLLLGNQFAREQTPFGQKKAAKDGEK